MDANGKKNKQEEENSLGYTYDWEKLNTMVREKGNDTGEDQETHVGEPHYKQ